MSRITIAADPQNTIFELSKIELQDPKALMAAFCHAMPLGMTREFLWNLLKSGLRDRYCGEILENRELLLEFYETLKKAVLAMYVVFDGGEEVH
jgi:hypothetical protein